MSGSNETKNDTVNPFAGLADDYEGTDELMLEALGLKPPPESSVPQGTRTEGASESQPQTGVHSADMYDAILAAIPDVVRETIRENGALTGPMEQERSQQSAGRDETPKPPSSVLAEEESTEESGIVIESEDIREEPPGPDSHESAGSAPSTEPRDGQREEPRRDPQQEAGAPESGKTKMQGLLGRIRGRPASEIAQGVPIGAKKEDAATASRDQNREVQQLRAQLEKSKSEVELMRKKLGQLQAETVAFRKRLGEQVKEGNVRGREDVFKAVITVIDSVASALGSSKAGQDFDTLFAGVEMIERQFHQVLKPLGLEAIEAVGEKFNPSRHEAMQMVHSGKAAPGVVVEQIRRGYRVGDRLVRPAMVIVESSQPSSEKAE